MAYKINIPVEFNVAAKGIDNIIQQFQKGLGNVDVSSTLGRKISQMITKLQTQRDKLQVGLENGSLDKAGINSLSKLLSTFPTQINQINRAFEKVDLDTLKLSPTTMAQFKALEGDIDNAARAYKELQTIGGAFGKNTAALQTIRDAFGKNVQFSESLATTYGKLDNNAKNLTLSLTDQKAALDEATTKATQYVDALQKVQNIDTGTERNKRTNAALGVARKTGTFAIQEQLTQAVSSSKTIGGIRDNVISLIESQMHADGSGRFKSGGKIATEYILEQFGLGADSGALLATANTRINNISNALDNLFAHGFDTSKITSGYTAARDAITSAAADEYDNEYKALLKTAQDNYNAAQSEVNKAQTLYNTTAQKLKNTEMAKTTVEGQMKDSDYLNQLKTLSTKVEQLSNDYEKLLVQVRQDTTGGSADPTQLRGNISAGVMAIEQELDSSQRAEEFTGQLNAATKRWFSAQEIITQIKQGIRQAYNEIKELDAAMTNIAVVTDMSISDLWGQIDQYMSIAKQYGVTTKGVYEVSQLFYQQGIGNIFTKKYKLA